MIKKFNDPVRLRARSDIAKQEIARAKGIGLRRMTAAEHLETEKRFGARFVEEISRYHMRKMVIARPEASETVSRAIREFIFSETKDKHKFIERLAPYIGSRAKAKELLLAVAEDFMAASKELAQSAEKTSNTLNRQKAVPKRRVIID